MYQISESELVLMKIIWKNGNSALFSYIMEELEKEDHAQIQGGGVTGRDWKKNTVLTLLSRLVEKKFLKTNKIGRRNDYTAVVTQQEYQEMQTQTFLNRIYEGNARGLVSTLLRQDVISSADLKEIESFWAKKTDGM